MTNEIRNLLKPEKDIGGSMGIWVRVFLNENGRVHAPMISSCSKNKCRQVGNSEKGIYAFRRTVNSKMRCEEVSATAALLGHTEDVNERYYTCLLYTSCGSPAAVTGRKGFGCMGHFPKAGRPWTQQIYSSYRNILWPACRRRRGKMRAHLFRWCHPVCGIRAADGHIAKRQHRCV